MKTLFHFVILTFFASALISCNKGNSNSRDVILYWCSNNTDEIKFAKSITNEWNNNNPNDQVKYQAVPEGRSSEEIILAAVVGNTTPDIYSNMWQGDVEAYAQAGVLIAFDTLKGFNEFIYERCDSSVVEEIKSLDGHIYQIPW